MNYFAYGSNMLSQRLGERAPSASVVVAARLPRHRLEFHKRSRDGSGKCNAFETGDQKDEIIGVVFAIQAAEKATLDKAEGLGRGYRQKDVELRAGGAILRAYTYVADPAYIDDSLRPYAWYRDLVLAGARQNALPQDYVQRLEMVDAIEDPDPERARKHRRILEIAWREDSGQK